MSYLISKTMYSRKALQEANLRKALEEANIHYRHIDNFFWVLSSFLIILCGSTFYYTNKQDNILETIFIDLIMILVWYWYKQFHKDTAIKIQYYFDKINQIEKQLSIDVFPNSMIGLNTDLNKKIFPYYKHFIVIKNKTFHWLMVYVTYLFWFLFVAHIMLTIMKQLSITF